MGTLLVLLIPDSLCDRGTTVKFWTSITTFKSDLIQPFLTIGKNFPPNILNLSVNRLLSQLSFNYLASETGTCSELCSNILFFTSGYLNTGSREHQPFSFTRVPGKRDRHSYHRVGGKTRISLHLRAWLRKMAWDIVKVQNAFNECTKRWNQLACLIFLPLNMHNTEDIAT